MMLPRCTQLCHRVLSTRVLRYSANAAQCTTKGFGLGGTQSRLNSGFASVGSETTLGGNHDLHVQYDAVYNKSTPEIYDKWAKDGYNETAGDYSRGSLVSCTEKIFHLLTHNFPVPDHAAEKVILKALDAGCGTGNLVQVFGEEVERAEDFVPKHAAALRKFAFEWHGLDFSEGMLEVARAKPGLYEDLQQGDLKKTLCYGDATFDLVGSAGTFLQGHVGSEAIPELCRILKPNGLLVFTVRPQFFEETKDDWLLELARGGMTVLGIDSMPYAGGMEAPVISCIKSSSSTVDHLLL